MQITGTQRAGNAGQVPIQNGDVRAARPRTGRVTTTQAPSANIVPTASEDRPQLDAGSSTQYVKLAETTQQVDSLPETQGKTDVYAIMAMLHQMGRDLREANHATRQAALDTYIAKMGDVSEEMRQAAQKAFVSGLVMGGMTMAMGAVSSVSAVRSMAKLSKPTQQMKHAAKGLQQAQKGLQSAQEGLQNAQTQISRTTRSGPLPRTIQTKLNAKQAKVAQAKQAVSAGKAAQQTAQDQLNTATGLVQAQSNKIAAATKIIEGSTQIGNAILKHGEASDQIEQQEAQIAAQVAQTDLSYWTEAHSNQKSVNQEVAAITKAIMAAEHETNRTVWQMA